MTTSFVTVAAVQSALTDDVSENNRRMSELVREAAGDGAQIVLMSELFEGHYFPYGQREEEFARARPVAEHPTLAQFSELARELEVVLPVSFYEKDGPSYYNSIAIIDADGRNLGVYRKSHIPDGPGYQEKYYFRPGNSGFRAWSTRYARIGVGICWDQWFPEAARAMALLGAEILFYPTAIGSEPEEPGLNTKDPWQRAMIGHAVCNAVGLVAANRSGSENGIDFYGHSFIADHQGTKVAELADEARGVISASFDLDAMARYRAGFGFFRDRRTDLYGPLLD
ncbi:N-carbamoylputrescine amidase [Haliangium ochraceum]|uniref:N-carbamoylputrescine amidase n=1 Tax=Haliangium ochraceum (strain DSM 14365 / JCM 11303 / SMP-2) TaxID=502025 RepID=D0LNZ6_HALO1|nr:N-carbamoylputrescine amidase [Haliangium ochraceum]ACY18822.1 N-carbamoylputrescine amidase [Haliangium ochraceum DSM 14365]